MTKMFGCTALATALLAIVPAANAAQFSCSYKPQEVHVYGDGMLAIKHAGNASVLHVCNMSVVRGGVSVQTCAMWASMLLSLKQNNRVAFMLYEATPTVTSCAGIPAYHNALTPILIGDQTPVVP